MNVTLGRVQHWGLGIPWWESRCGSSCHGIYCWAGETAINQVIFDQVNEFPTWKEKNVVLWVYNKELPLPSAWRTIGSSPDEGRGFQVRSRMWQGPVACESVVWLRNWEPECEVSWWERQEPSHGALSCPCQALDKVFVEGEQIDLKREPGFLNSWCRGGGGLGRARGQNKNLLPQQPLEHQGHSLRKMCMRANQEAETLEAQTIVGVEQWEEISSQHHESHPLTSCGMAKGGSGQPLSPDTGVGSSRRCPQWTDQILQDSPHRHWGGSPILQSE